MNGKIRIEGSGFPSDTRVFLNDTDITHCVQRVEVAMGIDQAPHVHLDLISFVDLHEEFEAEIVAYLPEEFIETTAMGDEARSFIPRK